MRLLCLLFPRLPIQLARRRSPELAGRPFVVLSGEGDAALVAAVSPEAGAAGIEPGMLAAAARSRCQRLATVASNAGDCLDALETAASILRTRATPHVALHGGDCLVLDLRGLESRFASEADAATSLAMLVRSWTGLDVRAGIAAGAADARAAARAALRSPIVAPLDASEVETLAYDPAPAIGAAFSWPAPATAVEVRARIARVLASFESILAARDESFRALVLTVAGPDGDTATIQVTSHDPLHDAADAMSRLAPQLGTALLDGAVRLDLSMRRLGPAMRVEPLRHNVAAAHFATARDPRRPLLRAS